jgi:hypothetical protein
MATSDHIKKLYETRRRQIKKFLEHGDVKRLAEKLINTFPDITKSELPAYASYLSQVFNAQSTRPFKDDLARQIEQVWDGLEYGTLDNFNAEQEHQHIMKHQFNNFKEEEDIQRIKRDTKQRNNWENDLSKGFKDESLLPTIALDALQWRIHKKYPNATILTNEILRFNSGSYIADIVVLANDSSASPILIVETGTNPSELNKMKKVEHLDFLVTESGASRGLLAILENGEITENWLQNKNQ